eukprot:m.503529 g.503529  ORF g.503529 m.503529 type:complete len:581 (+) comp21849_c0_seq3:116-1858(+)
MFLAGSLVCFLVLCSTSSSAAGDLTVDLQQILSEHAQTYNVSFSLGFYPATGDPIAVAASPRGGSLSERNPRHEAPWLISNRSLFPMGSVTKTYTAVGVMRLVEAGKVRLDNPIAEYVDPMLKTMIGKTLEEFFTDQRIKNATVRHFLSMRSGCDDYNDTTMLRWTLEHPTDDFTPADYISNWTKTLRCAPGSCGYYSSVGFDLLGVLLAAQNGFESWLDYDQLSALPQSVLNALPLKNCTTFPLLGKCSTHPGVVPQWCPDPVTYKWVNLQDYSCLNGWTMGNIAAAPLDVAAFYFYLLSGHEPRMLSHASLVAMTTWTNLSFGWGVGVPYGLGLMDMGANGSFLVKDVVGLDDAHVDLVGHGGEDWGSAALMTGYSTQLDAGVSLAMDSVMGKNSSAVNQLDQSRAYGRAFCAVWSALLKARGLPTPDCAAAFPPRGTCICPHGYPYLQNAPLSWAAGSGKTPTCDEVFTEIQDDLGVKTCANMTTWLEQRSMFEPSRDACCSGYSEARFQCICDAGQHFNGTNTIAWNKSSKQNECAETLEFLWAHANLTSCDSLRQLLQKDTLLRSTQVSCCSESS